MDEAAPDLCAGDRDRVDHLFRLLVKNLELIGIVDNEGLLPLSQLDLVEVETCFVPKIQHVGCIGPLVHIVCRFFKFSLWYPHLLILLLHRHLALEQPRTLELLLPC